MALVVTVGNSIKVLLFSVKVHMILCIKFLKSFHHVKHKTVAAKEINMKIYKFYDTDITGWEEYDITGEDYKELMRTCCKYSHTMSFTILDSDVVSYIYELEKFAIEKEENIQDISIKYSFPGKKISHM